MCAPCHHEVYRVAPLILGKVLGRHHFDFMALTADTLHDLFSRPLGQLVVLAGGERSGGKYEAEIHAQRTNCSPATRSTCHAIFPG